MKLHLAIVFEIKSRKDALNLGSKILEIFFRHKADIGIKRKMYYSVWLPYETNKRP
jgi:hypothetical protein